MVKIAFAAANLTPLNNGFFMVFSRSKYRYLTGCGVKKVFIYPEGN